MRDLLSWNLSLGKWGGIKVRLHVFFILFAVVALHLATHGADGHLLWITLVCLGLLLASLLAHEFAHCIAASKFGGGADQIVIWPLGGLTQPSTPHDPQQEFWTALAGPVANLAVCAVISPLLLILYRHSLVSLLNPLAPPMGADGALSGQVVLSWMFWINWLLAVVNLLPAYPLDGGRALRAILWANTKHSFRESAALAARVAKLTACCLWIAAFLANGSAEYSFAFLPLLLTGVLLFFGARTDSDRLGEQESEEAVFGYDFSQGYTSLEKTLAPPRKQRPGPIKKWLAEKRAARLLEKQRLEAEEERRVDEVLARLHEHGPGALTEDDRSLLARVSARYRNRQRS